MEPVKVKNGKRVRIKTTGQANIGMPERGFRLVDMRALACVCLKIYKPMVITFPVSLSLSLSLLSLIHI